jgi:hypothetical protein
MSLWLVPTIVALKPSQVAPDDTVVVLVLVADDPDELVLAWVVVGEVVGEATCELPGVGEEAVVDLAVVVELAESAGDAVDVL